MSATANARTSVSSTEGPRTGPSRRSALAVLCTGFLMVILDTTIVSVALPTIQDDLGFAASQYAWIVNAYLVTFGGLLLLAGRAGDLIGRRRMFVAGLAVFVAASLLCGLAQSASELIAARFLQGAGGAMASAVILGMLVALFPAPGEQAKAIGVYSFVGAAGASIGLVCGGTLTDALDWRWVFLVNLPIGIATIAFALRVLEPDRGLGLRQGADLPGAVLMVGALTVGLYAIVGADRHGLTSARTVGLLAVSAALLGGFVAWEARARVPLVPLGFFRARSVAAANIVQVLMIAGYFGQQFLVALYLQRVLGFSPAEVGLGMLPIAIAIGATSLGLAASVIEGAGARKALVAGLGLAAASLAVLSQVPGDGTYLADVLPALVVLGIGGGLSMPAVTTIAMSGTGPADAGLASGVINTTQQVGAAIGFAVLATIASTRTEQLTAGGRSVTEALAAGYGLGFLGASLSVLSAAVLALSCLPRS